MSVRVEWSTAVYTSVEVVPNGTRIGEDIVTEEAAIVFSADNVFVLEGNIARIRARLVNAIAELDRLGVEK
jgi:hypothetical protein